ncbi:MAG: glycerophosphodiester phosphodiesterase family protein [Desulfobacterales bacterium]|jgi:glycerophosphoryl diester phosphodiesterase
MRAADAVTARAPIAPPPPDAWPRARIVAHRGIYDNRQVFENTLDAFDAARAAGIWGLECDVRWTRDGTAIVHHDPDGRRLFGVDTPIEDLTWPELHRRCPLIPTLDTVVARYGRHLHLMIEVKAAVQTRPDRINQSLAEALAPLEPERDFHLMSMTLDLLAAIEALPQRACLPIAGLNVRAAARAVVAHGYGGLTGHYALIGRRRIADLHRRGRRIGTGFINSRGCLFREMARGIDWLFTDRALVLRRLVRRGAGVCG